MRDYDMERFLMHYGIPGMKRPRGLKYKTKNNGSVSLYQRRKEQMNKDSSTADEDLRKKAKVRLLTYSQRNTGVNSPEKRAKREEDRKKFQEELNARVAERERNEQEKLETAKKKMQQSKNKLLGKSDYKSDYSSDWTKKVNDIQSKNKAAAITNETKKIAQKNKATDRMKKYGMIPGSPEYELKKLDAKAKNIMNFRSNKSNSSSKYGGNNVKNAIDQRNSLQEARKKAKKVKKNGYKG